MDKQTLSNYGWIIIVILVLAVMITLATPFGGFIKNAVKSTTQGLFDTNKNSVNIAIENLNTQMQDQKFENNNQSIQPNIDPILENNDWATIQAVIKEGRINEIGWTVGDTKSVEINGEEYETTIIGIDHDRENTATFMILDSNGIGNGIINSDGSNVGGWKESDIRDWLNSTVFKTMSNKEQIVAVSKASITGIASTEEVIDNLFLLSCKEYGIAPGSFAMMTTAWNNEGVTYEWFANGGTPCDGWTRTYLSVTQINFARISTGGLNIGYVSAEYPVHPAFVIG